MGHIRLDGIQSTGSSYIDTGYVAKSENYRIKMQFVRGSQYGGALFGIVGADEDSLCIVISNPVMILVGGSTIVFDSITFEENTTHSIDLHVNNGSVSVTFDGVTYNSTYTGAINKTLSMYLCAYNAENTADNITSMCSFATCQIYDDDELVRDYIAAKDEDGYIGFYENISKVLYRSPFDSFYPGVPFGYIPDNKSELTPIEYVESTGNQMVVTYLFASDETRTVCDFKFTGDNESEGISFLFGSIDYFQGTIYGFCAENSTDTFKTMIGFTGMEGIITSDYDRHTVSLSSKETLFDGTKVYGDTYEDFYVRRLFITFFGTFFQGTPYGFSKAKMYSCKIYENDLLVADFKPYAYMGVAGLYNSVDNTLYFSITDSQLIAGPQVAKTLDFESQPFGFRRRLLIFA